jgi:DNA-directed RNA polymerase specialized sigma24 family protein
MSFRPALVDPQGGPITGKEGGPMSLAKPAINWSHVTGKRHERVLQLAQGIPISQPFNEAVSWKRAAHDRRQIQRRLSGNESEEVCRAYQAGLTIRELSAQFAVHKTTVTAVLERAGIDRRIRTISAGEVTRATRLYREGLSTATIGAALGFSAETIRSSLIRNGVPLRPRRGWTSE